MYLSITTTHRPATDLGYLLHKHPERVCLERNAARPDRDFGPHVVRRQTANLRRSLGGLSREGFRQVFTLSSVEEVNATTIERQPLWNNRTYEHGSFDIIGDVHGCADELLELLVRLGYRPAGTLAVLGRDTPLYGHPEGRKAVFLGDLVDRGPRILDTVRIVQVMVSQGTALCVPGNHDMKLLMSRFAVDPHWLVYLPPTMAPCATSSEPDLLEHPAEALAYYRDEGVTRVICEAKHMGSRAVAIVCKNEETAQTRLG
jgi:hypothetical protein